MQEPLPGSRCLSNGVLIAKLGSGEPCAWASLNERMFDETYNIREVLDDVIERVTMREKLIQTAKQFVEKKRDERFSLAVRQFENLMTDFLKLYQPILESVRSHRDYLQKELTGLRVGLNTTHGMLEVSKGVEGLGGRVQRLEADVAELEGIIREKTKLAEKIDDLLKRVKPYVSGASSLGGAMAMSDVLGGMPKDLFLDLPEPGREAGTAKKPGLHA